MSCCARTWAIRRERIDCLFDTETALMTGVVQNQDSYMKGRIGQRAYYAAVPSALAHAMDLWAEETGRQHSDIDAYRCDDAEEIIVAIGTIADTARAVVDVLRRDGRAVGAVGITSYRPFPADHLAAVLRNAKVVAIVERTDEPAAADNPLTRETKAALYAHAEIGTRVPRVVAVSAGLGSRDVDAADLAGVFDWARGIRPGDASFGVVGVRHTLAIPSRPIDIAPAGSFALRGHSIGGLGSITTNKLLATVMGEVFGKQVQAYPRYGSEKKGLPTSYSLTIADEPIRGHCELRQVNLVSLHDVSAFELGESPRRPGRRRDGVRAITADRRFGDLVVHSGQCPCRHHAPTDPGHGAGHGRPCPGSFTAPRPDPSAAGRRPCRRIPAYDHVRHGCWYGSRRHARSGRGTPASLLREARR